MVKANEFYIKVDNFVDMKANTYQISNFHQKYLFQKYAVTNFSHKYDARKLKFGAELPLQLLKVQSTFFSKIGLKCWTNLLIYPNLLT